VSDRVCWWRETTTKCMTRSLNVTPKTTLLSGKSEAKVTIIWDSARVIILLRLNTNGHKASRGLSATAELLVFIPSVMATFQRGLPNWSKNRDFRLISDLAIYDCYSVKRRVWLSPWAAAFVYHADGDEVPASVNLVYDSKPRHRFYQSTGIGRAYA